MDTGQVFPGHEHLETVSFQAPQTRDRVSNTFKGGATRPGMRGTENGFGHDGSDGRAVSTTMLQVNREVQSGEFGKPW